METRFKPVFTGYVQIVDPHDGLHDPKIWRRHIAEAYAEEHYAEEGTEEYASSSRRSMREHLMNLAYWSQEKAFSYRGKRVGAAVMAERPYVEGQDVAVFLNEERRFYPGSNTRPFSPSRSQCAEHAAVGAARNDACRRILAIACFGEPQADDESGLIHRTLHICGSCRRYLPMLPEVCEDTRILTGVLEGGRIYVEEWTLKTMCDLHAEAVAERAERAHNRRLRAARQNEKREVARELEQAGDILIGSLPWKPKAVRFSELQIRKAASGAVIEHVEQIGAAFGFTATLREEGEIHLRYAS